MAFVATSSRMEIFSVPKTIIIHTPDGQRTYESCEPTAKDIIEGLSYQVPELQPSVDGSRMAYQVVGMDRVEDLYDPLPEDATLVLVPVIEGEKGKFTQILVGAAIIAFAGPLGALNLPLLGALGKGYFMALGVQLILGGVAQMLSPVPEEEDAGKQSKYLGTPKNTVAIGTRIPILYGEFRCGGHILSFDTNSGSSS